MRVFARKQALIKHIYEQRQGMCYRMTWPKLNQPSVSKLVRTSKLVIVCRRSWEEFWRKL